MLNSNSLKWELNCVLLTLHQPQPPPSMCIVTVTLLTQFHLCPPSWLLDSQSLSSTQYHCIPISTSSALCLGPILTGQHANTRYTYWKLANRHFFLNKIPFKTFFVLISFSPDFISLLMNSPSRKTSSYLLAIKQFLQNYLINWWSTFGLPLTSWYAFMQFGWGDVLRRFTCISLFFFSY